jgi:hypothetical protein
MNSTGGENVCGSQVLQGAGKERWVDSSSKVLTRTSNNSSIRPDTAPFIVLGKDEYTRVHQAQLARAT